MGGVIASIEPGSAAAAGRAAGLRPGDRLLAINGHPLRDVIDVQFYGADETLDLLVERDGRPLHFLVRRRYDRPLGLTFTHPTFDVDIRRCRNDCDFCFVKQNAPAMRKSLYVKDDDYRFSFLSGSFVTLTNLTEADWARLEEQRLSPLYVSVHATDPELRRRTLGLKSAPDVVDQLRRLADLGIEVHTQVVLVPGVNDGEHLAQTVAGLRSTASAAEALHDEPVASVSIVPIGLTRFHRGSCRPYTPEQSRAVLDQVEGWRVESREQRGCTFVYPSDEWYLVAGRDVPPADEYDDFPQVENGVGMVRQLLDEWQELKGGLLARPLKRATLACGTLIAPVLGPIVDEFNRLAGGPPKTGGTGGYRLRLRPVVNRLFGAVTTVSGLLAGRDVVEALQGESLGDFVLLPRAMFTGRYGAGDAPPGTTLDDLSIADLSAQLGVRVEMAGTLTEALDVIGRAGEL